MISILRAGRFHLVGVLVISTVVGPAGSTESVPGVLHSIKTCLVDSATPWPAEWQQAYLKTIEQVVREHEGKADFSARLGILRKGFPLFWKQLDKSVHDEARFGVYQAEIRWYVDYLMSETIPSEADKRIIESQYATLFREAAESIRTQFPELDAKATQAALEDCLGDCHERITAPLMPIYFRPLSESQLERIRARWNFERFNDSLPQQSQDARGTNSERSTAGPDPRTHLHYAFVMQCLYRVLGTTWQVVAKPPDYCVQALKRHQAEVQDQRATLRRARREEIRLRSRFGTTYEQVEQWSFVLAALLETATHQSGNRLSATDDERMKGGEAP